MCAARVGSPALEFPLALLRSCVQQECARKLVRISRFLSFSGILRGQAYMTAVELLVELASLQTAFLTLDEAIKTTNRRVNALDNVVIPKLENTIAYIKARRCACMWAAATQAGVLPALLHQSKVGAQSMLVPCLVSSPGEMST